VKESPHNPDNTTKALSPDKYVSIFKKALKSYASDHPHWQIEVLVSLIKWGLRNLRHSIERKRNTKISWDEPFLKLHYPVKWDWKSKIQGDEVRRKQILGRFTRANTSDIQKAGKTLSQVMTTWLYTMALGLFTNDAWFEKRENTYIPYLPNEINAAVNEIKDRSRKQAAFEEIFRPFSIGTARIYIPESELKKNGRISKNVAKQVQTIGHRMDIPGVQFSGDINGRKIWAGLIFEIEPLIIDYDSTESRTPDIGVK
jgi:hypothetical protein